MDAGQSHILCYQLNQMSQAAVKMNVIKLPEFINEDLLLQFLVKT